MMKELEMCCVVKDLELSLLRLAEVWLRDHLITILMYSRGEQKCDNR